MRTVLFGALPCFELGGIWRCGRDRDGEGERVKNGEGDKGVTEISEGRCRRR